MRFYTAEINNKEEILLSEVVGRSLAERILDVLNGGDNSKIDYE